MVIIMYLSKSKYCKGIQCPKILWLEANNPDVGEYEDNSGVFENGAKVGELAKRLFGNYLDVSFNEDLNEMIKDTKALLFNNKVIITEASFNYDNNFCSIDILKKDNDNYEIYEVKSSTEVSDIYLEDVSYQYYVLTSLGYNVTKACIVHIDNTYVRGKELEIDKLFKIVDVTDIAISKQKDIPNRIAKINKYVDGNTVEPEMDIDNYCHKPYDCPFFNYCSGNLKRNSVFSLRKLQFRTKLAYYRKGIVTFDDLMKSDLDDKYKKQVDFVINNKDDYVDKKFIEEFLSDLSYPLYFLDFETCNESIPEYEGVRPYQQIPFQYSLHYIEEEGGELKHKEYLADENGDPRRGVAETLVKDIPMNACTLAYNMSFERGVIDKLAAMFPDLSKHLLSIKDNIYDLEVPFDLDNGYYYSKDMLGSSSIKYVLPALYPNDPSLDYHNLDLIHNGTEAMKSFATLKDMNEEDKKKYRESLLRYCELDTYAMVKVWEKLKEAVKM